MTSLIQDMLAGIDRDLDAVANGGPADVFERTHNLAERSRELHGLLGSLAPESSTSAAPTGVRTILLHIYEFRKCTQRPPLLSHKTCMVIGGVESSYAEL